AGLACGSRLRLHSFARFRTASPPDSSCKVERSCGRAPLARSARDNLVRFLTNPDVHGEAALRKRATDWPLAWGRRSVCVVCPGGGPTWADHKKRWSAPRVSRPAKCEVI